MGVTKVVNFERHIVGTVMHMSLENLVAQKCKAVNLADV